VLLPVVTRIEPKPLTDPQTALRDFTPRVEKERELNVVEPLLVD
jgi:hypothetical protein